MSGAQERGGGNCGGAGTTGSLPLAAGPLDHVGIAVRDLDAACAHYVRVLGGRLVHRQRIESGGVEVAFIDLGGPTRIELIAPLDRAGAVARFLERRGGGLHHICCLVEDVDAELARARRAGLRLVDVAGRPGAAGSRIGFLHPDALGGVLLELKQKAAGGQGPQRAAPGGGR